MKCPNLQDYNRQPSTPYMSQNAYKQKSLKFIKSPFNTNLPSSMQSRADKKLVEYVKSGNFLPSCDCVLWSVQVWGKVDTNLTNFNQVF